MITKNENEIKVFATKVGTFYRQEDILVEVKNKFTIISRNFKGGVDLIESLSNGQRRSHPKTFRDIKEALSKLVSFTIKLKDEILIVRPNQTLFRLA